MYMRLIGPIFLIAILFLPVMPSSVNANIIHHLLKKCRLSYLLSQNHDKNNQEEIKNIEKITISNISKTKNNHWIAAILTQKNLYIVDLKKKLVLFKRSNQFSFFTLLESTTKKIGEIKKLLPNINGEIYYSKILKVRIIDSDNNEAIIALKKKERPLLPVEIARIVKHIHSELESSAMEKILNILAVVNTRKLTNDYLLGIGYSKKQYEINFFSNKLLEQEARQLLTDQLKNIDVSYNLAENIKIFHLKFPHNKSMITGETRGRAMGPFIIPYAIMIKSNQHYFQERLTLFHEIKHVVDLFSKYCKHKNQDFSELNQNWNSEFLEISATIFSLNQILKNKADLYKLWASYIISPPNKLEDYLSINDYLNPEIYLDAKAHLNFQEEIVFGKEILDTKQKKEKIDVDFLTKQIVEKRKEADYEKLIKEKAENLFQQHSIQINQLLKKERLLAKL